MGQVLCDELCLLLSVLDMHFFVVSKYCVVALFSDFSNRYLIACIVLFAVNFLIFLQATF